MRPPDGIAWTDAGPDRSGAVAAMAARAFDPHYREAWNEAQIAGLLVSGAGWLLLGEDVDGIAAFSLCRFSGDEGELLLCATRPDQRRKGVATQMLSVVAEAARRRGAQRLLLEVRATNAPALSLYLANGFQQVGVRSGYYRTMTGASIDAVTLALDLTCPSSAGTNANNSGNLAQAPHR